MKRQPQRDATCLIWAAAFFLILASAIQPTAASETNERASVKEGGPPSEDGVGYFQLPPMNVPIIHGNRVERILTVAVTVEAKGDGNKKKIIAERYHLQDAFLRDLHGIASLRRADGKIIDPRVVKARLMRISERLLGQGVVADIFIQNIFNRDMP